MRIDVDRLAEQSRGALSEGETKLLRALAESVDLEGSARDGDIVARARVALR